MKHFEPLRQQVAIDGRNISVFPLDLPDLKGDNDGDLLKLSRVPLWTSVYFVLSELTDHA